MEQARIRRRPSNMKSVGLWSKERLTIKMKTHLFNVGISVFMLVLLFMDEFKSI